MATDVISVPVSCLTSEARSILDNLNARRLFASDGPGGLSRDIRGLANLCGFTAQESWNLTVRSALERWVSRNGPSATVQLLLRYLEIIDRYDIRDDLQELAAANRLVVEPTPDNVEAYTTDDLELGVPQHYDALVIHAEENRVFVERMFNIMQEIGFKLFKKHGLEPGYMEQEAMVELIDARCRHTILVFSPALFRSLDEKFYLQYAHAKQIATNTRHMIPVVYQKCQPFKELSRYTTLKVADPQFWRRLALNLNNGRNPRLQIPSWLTSVDVAPAHILPPFPTVQINEYYAPRTANDTRYPSEANRQANSLSQRTNAFVTNNPAANQTYGRIEGSRRIDSVPYNQHTNLFATNNQLINQRRRIEDNRRSVNGCSPHNMFVTNRQVTKETPYRVNGHSSQHSDVYSANESRNRLVSDEVSDESSANTIIQYTNAPNVSIANRKVSNTNSQVAEAHVRPHPNEYFVSVQIVTDHIGEHPNITDSESTQSSQTSTSYISSDRTVNSHSSPLNTSATRSSLPSTYTPNDQTVDSQSSLLTTSSSARSSLIDDFTRWCRDKRLWVARNRLFPNRTRTLRAK